jgi:hypothetical protein
MVRKLLTFVLAGLVCLALPTLGGAGETKSAASPFKGEYFVTRNQDPVCVPFAKNLNQFRRLDFDVCHPRLSEKYPQFTRPAWEAIPFDLNLAETIFKNPPRGATNADWWQVWLKASEALRVEGKLTLWRTRIDIDNDGALETIVRFDYPLAPTTGPQAQEYVVEPPCPYRHNMLYMLDAPKASLQENFNQMASYISDIIHFTGGQVFPGQSNGYYATSRLTIPASPDGDLIGATRGTAVYQVNNWGAAKVCSINWVPTGQYRPLRPSRSPR